MKTEQAKAIERAQRVVRLIEQIDKLIVTRMHRHTIGEIAEIKGRIAGSIARLVIGEPPDGPIDVPEFPVG